MKVEPPKAYQKGFTIFLGSKIDLSQRVLIPRTETAYWVRKAIKVIQKDGKSIEALDIFAGSGCIGIAILQKIPSLCHRLDFADKSQKAIKQIKINLEINEIPRKKYRIYKSSFFNKIPEKKYDFIFANPPYVATKRTSEVGESVLKYEPQEALFSGEEGLKHIEQFLKKAKPFLKKEGYIFLECDPQQKGRIEKILQKQNYSFFRFYKDQFKKYRFVKIKK